MNWYRNAHFFTSNKVKTTIHELLLEQLKEQTLIQTAQYQVTYLLYYKNPASDLSNFCALASKWFLDALQEAKLITNDNVKVIVQEIYQVAGQDKQDPRIEATIIPIIRSH